MSSFIDILTGKYQTYSDKKTARIEAERLLAAAIAHEAEMTRQYGEKNGEGDTLNANILYPKMIAARAELTRIQNLVSTTTGEEKAAQADYDNYKKTLSPSEQATVEATIKNQSEAVLQQAQAVNYAAKSKVYIIGGVVLIVLVIVYFYYKRKAKKASGAA